MIQNELQDAFAALAAPRLSHPPSQAVSKPLNQRFRSEVQSRAFRTEPVCSLDHVAALGWKTGRIGRGPASPAGPGPPGWLRFHQPKPPLLISPLKTSLKAHISPEAAPPPPHTHTRSSELHVQMLLTSFDFRSTTKEPHPDYSQHTSETASETSHNTHLRRAAGGARSAGFCQYNYQRKPGVAA